MDSEQLKREILAQMQLQDAGSVMAKEPTPQLFGGHPVLDPLAQTIGQLLNNLNPLDWMSGGGGSLAHVPGTYRALGLQRVRGDLNPAQYVAQLQAQPNYQRYVELVQNLIKRTLGETFPVARGAAQTDPLIQALQQGAGKLPVTAVSTRVAGSPNFSAPSENFARLAAENTRKPGFVAYGQATPKDVAAIVPTRQAFTGEGELVLNPQSNLGMELAAKYIPASGGFPTERKVLDAAPSYVDEILQALQQAAQPPMP